MADRELIPRKTLFENPSAFGAKLSPDGQMLTWIAPVDDVLNVWIAPSDDIANAEPLTRTTGRPIGWQTWSADGRYVVFLNDETGDEKHHLFVVDPASKSLRDLTPYDGVSAGLKAGSRTKPGKLIVMLNDRDERWHDLYEIDVETGRRSLVWQNTQGFSAVQVDWDYAPRFASSNGDDGGTQYWRIDGSAHEPWFQVPFEDKLTSGFGTFDYTNKRIVKWSSVGRNTLAVSWLDWETEEESLLVEHPRYDVSGALIHPITFDVEAASIHGARKEWIYRTLQVERDFDFLEMRLPDFEIEITSQSDDNRRWIVVAHKAEEPAVTHLYDRDRQSVDELFRARPKLKPYKLAPMHAIVEKARDGLELQSYLTLPVDCDGDRPGAPLPMVLVVHGGPWARDTYGYRGDHQWLANRGYAVLSVNYRGSAGFGKDFIAASEKQHAAKMHDDLIDMVEWAVREGIAEREKVAITGGSYGGYASFVAATFSPDVFCCAIPVVGITNLQTLLESMPPYWAGFAEFMYRSYGDPRTDEGRALLAERSPIHKVGNISKPMLIFHGANDVRCKVAESDQIVAAMQEKNIPVTYVVYPDEGHGFHKPENRLAYIAITEAFLARHLGGACEPIGHDFEGSSRDVRADDGIVAELVGNAAP